MRAIVHVLLLGVSIVMLPSVAFAQSSITGVVRDTTGAILPGVTVEAASPALIEKVRTVVTDGQGVYRIVDLRPGAYVVTFTLTGFSTVRREGIELPASFTATVNAELRVGALEETVTVSGQTPLLDTQSVTTQRTLSTTLLNALPTNRTPQGLMMALPAVVGPFPGASDRDSKGLAVHGSRAANVAIAGFITNLAYCQGGACDVHYPNLANVEELVVNTGGGGAEQQFGGVYTDIVPKEGGNTFSGFFYGSYSGEGLQADNLPDDLRARGLNTTNSYKRLWDINPAVGGRIVRDKLWFYSSVRNTGSITYVPYLSYPKDPKAWKYEKDDSRKGEIPSEYPDMSTRLTWQATPKNKISAFFDLQSHHVDHRAPPTNQAITSIEATNYLAFFPNSYSQVLWRSTLNNRLLLEAGTQAQLVDWNKRRNPTLGVGYDTIAAQESTLNLNYRAAWPLGNDNYQYNVDHAYTNKASLSYVSGSQALKAGVQIRWGSEWAASNPNGDLYHGVQLRNFVPISLTQVALPDRIKSRVNAEHAVFVQDRWTVARLTLNLGLRYDYFNASTVGEHLPAGPFVPARDFPAVKDVPNWHDLSPRLGVAYDLFGDGKTALKASLNRSNVATGAALARANNPVNTSVTSVTRTWGDANNNFTPDCDLKNPLANGECGQISNLNFGQANPRATRYDDEVLRGFGKRPYEWEASVAVQRELVSGLVVDVGYFRRWYGNFTVTDNLDVTPADYDPYCLTAPVDARLPGGGGHQLCGFADIQPAKFGRVQNFVTFAKNFGTQTEIFNGVDVTVGARFPGGLEMFGGLSTGRTTANSCFVVDSPQQLLYCDHAPPFTTQYKVSTVYRLPWWGIETSGVFQSFPPLAAGALFSTLRPGPAATYVATSAEALPSLRRNLAAGFALVPLAGPFDVYLDRFNQLDFRLSKVFTVNKARISANIDVFNLLNSSATQLANARFGPSWLLPTQTQIGRYVQFSTQLRF